MTVSFWEWWILAGLCLGAELLRPGSYLLWVGLGAATAGLTALFAPWLGSERQAMVMAAATLIFAALGRRFYKRLRQRLRAGAGDAPHELVGRRFPLDQAIVNGSGWVRLAGTLWRVTGPDLAAGRRVRVEAVEGRTLTVVPAEQSGREEVPQ